MTDGRNMKVGDIGVLQNSILYPHMNGSIAEIIGDLRIRNRIYDGNPVRILCFLVRVPVADLPMSPSGDGWGVELHRIRPLRDPDQTIEQEQTEEMI